MNHLAPGPMTLEFRLGPIPVRIHIWFVFVALLLGLGAQRGITRVVAWAIGFLFTVFAHELSHAIAARSFGVPAEVHLRPVRWLSAASAAALGLVAVRRGMAFPALVSGLVAFQNAHGARALGAASRKDEKSTHARLQAAFIALEHHIA
jgi:hypothetical protein